MIIRGRAKHVGRVRGIAFRSRHWLLGLRSAIALRFFWAVGGGGEVREGLRGEEV